MPLLYGFGAELMDLGIIIVWAIIGYIFYKLFSSNSNSKQKRRKRKNRQNPEMVDGYYVRSTGRGTKRPDKKSDKAKASYIQVAKRMESMGKYEEASKNYLQGGQIYSSAKMQAMMGPNHSQNAVNVIRENAGGQYDSILQNLVNEFYYRLHQPATAASLLRSAGKIDEAMAVEIAAGITPQPAAPTPNPPVTPMAPVTPPEVQQTEPEPQISSVAAVQEEVVPAPKTEVETKPSNGTYPNTLLLASMTLSDPCIVCRKPVNAGESFLHCLNCGKTGHYKHVAEIMKVTGKCPSCKERLVISMYEIE